MKIDFVIGQVIMWKIKAAMITMVAPAAFCAERPLELELARKNLVEPVTDKLPSLMKLLVRSKKYTSPCVHVSEPSLMNWRPLFKYKSTLAVAGEREAVPVTRVVPAPSMRPAFHTRSVTTTVPDPIRLLLVLRICSIVAVVSPAEAW